MLDRGLVVLLVLAVMANAQLPCPAVLSQVGDVDKHPRLDDTWVAWTRDGTPNPSMGTVVLRERVTGQLVTLAPGFKPDIEYELIVEGGVATEVMRVVYLEYDALADLIHVKYAHSLFGPSGPWTFETLDSSTYADHPRIDRAVMTWHAYDATSDMIVIRAFTVGTAGAVTVSDAACGHAFRPEIEHSALDVATIVWDQYCEGTATLDYEVFMSRNASGSWTAPVNLSNAPLSADLAPSLSPDGDGRMWVAWATDRSAPSDTDGTYKYRAYVTRVDVDGSTQLVPNAHPRLMTPAPADRGLVDLSLPTVRGTYLPHIQVDAQGKPWLFVEHFDKTNPLDKQYRYASYNDGTWSMAANPLVDSIKDETSLDLDMDGDTLVCAFQINTVGATPDIEVATDCLRADAELIPLQLFTPGTPQAHFDYGLPALPTDRTSPAGFDWRLVLADLHSHGGQSPDGFGVLDIGIVWARDIVGLDAWASTDHDSLGANPYLDYEFELAQHLVGLFDTSTFTAFMGFEWTNNTDNCDDLDACDLVDGEVVGHRATFSSSQVYRFTDDSFDSLCEYNAAMLADPDEPIGVPHHLGKFGGTTFLGQCFEPIVQPITQVSSVHDEFEDELVVKLRPMGGDKRFGVTSAGDTHDGLPGRSGIAALWIDETGAPPQREAIKDAAFAHTTYALRFDGMWLDFRVGGFPMGSEITVSPGTDLAIDYEIREFPFLPGQTITVNVVNVLDPGYLQIENVLHFEEFEEGVIGPLTPSTDPMISNIQADGVYMLRVTNGDQLQIANTQATLLWTTPVWVDVSTP